MVRSNITSPKQDDKRFFVTSAAGSAKMTHDNIVAAPGQIHTVGGDGAYGGGLFDIVVTVNVPPCSYATFIVSTDLAPTE